MSPPPPYVMIEVRHDSDDIAAVIHFETFERLSAWLEWLASQHAKPSDGDGRAFND